MSPYLDFSLLTDHRYLFLF
uniref:Uncharacterized protein n=1 Tax=Arundo donax TaxID=35708 RepID=A0A0A8Y7Y3_ARUDO